MDHSQERLIFPIYKQGPPQVSVPVPSGKVSWDEDLLHWPVQVSTLTGNIVHLQVLPGTLVPECRSASMYTDTWSCGTPVHLCFTLAINLSMAKTKASGGNLRLSTWDGDPLQDREGLQN